MKVDAQNDVSLATKLLTAGTAACIADLATFPLDTAKVRMQIAGEGRTMLMASAEGSLLAVNTAQPGLLQTVGNIVKTEGMRSLYGGLSAGLQRQMCFASVRLGLYDSVKTLYAGMIDGNNRPSSDGSINIGVRIAAGMTTGALAVLFAQPTDVVKVRLQAGNHGHGNVRYVSTLQAYKSIAMNEGTAGLWRGTIPNVSRNAIVNVAEIVCYDIIKEKLLQSGLLQDGIPCHLSAAVAAGLCTTIAASPVDVVKTRYMNSSPGEYKGAIDVAVRMFINEGPMAFYKGFVPSFARLVSWNIVLWVTYEQIKIQVNNFQNKRDSF
ncbi:dicarboxylate carrier SLC25A8-like [Phymastichus coffea]|uniref:dicarboxylate carrier SLC25A8-like n=1 Tax=Phymastichus coffea TaxID=108790 RepID=UPI00273C4123|nr:dicarboxylate carrier SLC25A8-like [Phymastichus coffea]